MQLDISREFLDAISLQHPVVQEGKEKINANGGLHFLPSSPDGTLHTVVAVLALTVEGAETPFAQGGWRFLFTSDEKFEPQQSTDHPFLQQLMMVGTSKVLTLLNNLCLHANLPILPIDLQRMYAAQQRQGAAQPPAGDAPPAAPPGGR